ncbi:hypothetical protein BD410DRAFT_485187 [Rickenella mellea]|uniref:Uncharacterized protein n=1 Tax=Rickenella mellea TaxID=50990 RepID=A0A4Y7QHG4_9AGAM|nr:hypothetical protein BD410DRAFT_485187 [Rickenella mellea]
MVYPFLSQCPSPKLYDRTRPGGPGIEVSLNTTPSSYASDYEPVKTKRVVTYFRRRLVTQQFSDQFASALVRSFFPSDGLYGKKPVKLVIKYIVAHGAKEEDSDVLFHDMEHATIQWDELNGNHTVVQVYAQVTDIEPTLMLTIAVDKEASGATSNAVEGASVDATKKRGTQVESDVALPAETSKKRKLAPRISVSRILDKTLVA